MIDSYASPRAANGGKGVAGLCVTNGATTTANRLLLFVSAESRARLLLAFPIADDEVAVMLSIEGTTAAAIAAVAAV